MGKSHGRDASPAYMYINDDAFFGIVHIYIYSISTDVCGDLGRAYD